jgi:2-C-methyl-D-erythritol 4-phosphate cytidylyltransferase
MGIRMRRIPIRCRLLCRQESAIIYGIMTSDWVREGGTRPVSGGIYMEDRCCAVLLAAGKGRRMGGEIPKQYLPLAGKPLLYYSLAALCQSPVITDLVLVIPEGDEEYVTSHILSLVPEGGEKVRCFVRGGAERYLSVQAGIAAIHWPCDYVFIHDGARPFLDEPTLERLYAAVKKTGACIAGMPTKDTVKLAGRDGFVERTPDRSRVWIVQTPQVFSYALIRDAYARLPILLPELTERGIHVTDDAMVVESITGRKVLLVEASYRNIKVTTPEDIPVSEALLACRDGN